MRPGASAGRLYLQKMSHTLGVRAPPDRPLETKASLLQIRPRDGRVSAASEQCRPVRNQLRLQLGQSHALLQARRAPDASRTAQPVHEGAADLFVHSLDRGRAPLAVMPRSRARRPDATESDRTAKTPRIDDTCRGPVRPCRARSSLRSSCHESPAYRLARFCCESPSRIARERMHRSADGFVRSQRCISSRATAAPACDGRSLAASAARLGHPISHGG